MLPFAILIQKMESLKGYVSVVIDRPIIDKNTLILTNNMGKFFLTLLDIILVMILRISLHKNIGL